MKHTTKRCLMHMARVRIHGLVILSCLVLALLGQMPESSGGWLSWPRSGQIRWGGEAPSPDPTPRGQRLRASECRAYRAQSHNGDTTPRNP